MQMKAISDKYTIEQAALMALSAGADMLLYRNMDDAGKALVALREAIKKKIIRREEILEKVMRIEKCKKENLATYQPIYIPKIADSFNTAESKKVMEQFTNILTAKA